MNRWFHWLARRHVLWGLAAVVLGADLFLAAIQEPWLPIGVLNPLFVCGVLGAVCGMAGILRQPWTRWATMVWLVLSVVSLAVIDWPKEGFPVLDSLRMVVLTLVGYALWKIDLTEDDGEDENKPFLSLVLLLREPRYLDTTILASLASRAWDIEITGQSDLEESSDENDSSEEVNSAFIVGESPLFMAKHPDAMLVIHNFDRPYFEDSEAAADDVIEVRAKHAVRQHQAWLAVDVLAWLGEGEGTSEAYRLIARLLAELADDNVLAVIDPDAKQLFCYDPETERKLRSENPLAELREWYHAPIIAVRSDDPAMVAAVAEARQRFPEFVAAFENRTPADEAPFAIKAPFGEGDDVEFMWVEVTGIENEIIYGILKNDPAHVPGLAEGDRVKVKTADLNDWVCIINDEPVGGFTMKVLSERAKGTEDEE